MAAELAAHAGNGQAAAEQEYRRALAARPNDPATVAGLAHVLMLEKKPVEAEAILTTALNEHAGDMGLTAQLADVYVSEGKTAQAAPLVEQMHASRPGDGAIARMLADLYEQSSEYAKAEPLLAALANQAPQDAALADDYAETLMHLGRHAEAERLLQRLVAQPHLFDQPPNGKDLLGEAASNLALAASENGDPTECLQALTLRDTVLPTSPSSLFLRAISHDKLRQRKEAIAAYKQFLAVANGKYPDQEFQARHRLVALDR
jgi:predicted Zn-dependent protease